MLICLVREDVHRNEHEGAQDEWKQTSCFAADAAKGKSTMQFADILAASNGRRLRTWHIVPCSRFLSPLADKGKQARNSCFTADAAKGKQTVQVRVAAIKIGDFWPPTLDEQ